MRWRLWWDSGNKSAGGGIGGGGSGGGGGCIIDGDNSGCSKGVEVVDVVVEVVVEKGIKVEVVVWWWKHR